MLQHFTSVLSVFDGTIDVNQRLFPESINESGTLGSWSTNAVVLIAHAYGTDSVSCNPKHTVWLWVFDLTVPTKDPILRKLLDFLLF